MLLTDEEVTLIVRECARGSAINRSGSTSHRIARAIEAAVLAKLREQEPVMTYLGKGVIDCGEHGHHNMEMHKLIPAGTKLFTHPAPIPEGFDAEFLAKRLARVAKLAGITMPDMPYESQAAVAGTILGEIASALERKA